jgi:hypothetical protein
MDIGLIDYKNTVGSAFAVVVVEVIGFAVIVI